MYSNILGTPIPLAVFNTLTCCAVPDLVYVAGLPRQWHWLPGYFQQHSYDDQGQVHGHQPACTLLHHGVVRAASGLADTLAAGLLVEMIPFVTYTWGSHLRFGGSFSAIVLLYETPNELFQQYSVRLTDGNGFNSVLSISHWQKKGPMES